MSKSAVLANLDRQIREATDELAKQIDIPFPAWAEQCHVVSLRLVRIGAFDHIARGRVARGTCRGVGGQHSWIVLGEDCYAPDAIIVDPTLWSYVPTVKGIWVGNRDTYGHRPHGSGSIWEYGQPAAGNGPPIELTPTFELSRAAKVFLEILGPLDRRGWFTLAKAPVEGWPASEILAAMDDTPGIKAGVPIDHLGMVTDRNPGGLYR